MQFNKLFKLLEFTLIEKKDVLIKRLPNLSEDEKTKIINFFISKNWDSKLEGMIDWNNKNLIYADFEPVLNYISKTSREQAVKVGGISGLKIGTDYFELKTDGTFKAYRPLTYEASKLIASIDIGGCEGKWCTAYQKSNSYWYDYSKSNAFIYIIFQNTKYAVQVDKTDFTKFDIWNNIDFKYEDSKWVNQEDKKKHIELTENDLTLLSKINQLLQNNIEILKYKIIINIKKYINGNKVNLKSLTGENGIRELREILIDSTEHLDLIYVLPASVYKLFENDKTIKTLGSNWDTSNVTNMSNMFSSALFANPDVSKWDTSNVTNMSSMFHGLKIADPDVSKWNTSSVTDMSAMFSSTKIANPNVSEWNTSKVTNMSAMFSGALSADPDVSADPNISKWDMSNVSKISYMFNVAKAANPDVSNWNVSKVTELDGVFISATKAKPNITKWLSFDNIVEKYKNIDNLKKKLAIKND